MKYVYSESDAGVFKKNVFGVDITGYTTNLKDLNVVYEETTSGRHEEFYDDVSTHIWFISEEKGEFVIDDERVKVQAKDVIIVPPKKRIYYRGNLKMLLITKPGFKPENEHHVRDIDFSD
ncbi:MAG: cupin domain-containing protein [Candidatus Saccharimonadales bacterium]